jgi:L-lactate dehydrogenase complex protein LldG
MTRALTDQFTRELDGLDVGWTRTTVADLPAVLADRVEPPVVGVPSAHEGVSLADLPVEVNTDPSLDELRAARTGVTDAALGVAPYGSVVLRTDRAATAEPASLFVDRHVVLLAERDLRGSVGEALSALGPLFREEDASAVLATGPSATADMGALVQGAHGPETVHVCLLTDR